MKKKGHMLSMSWIELNIENGILWKRIFNKLISLINIMDKKSLMILEPLKKILNATIVE